ncbi:hypothetical protein JOB18_046448 [Solea senegalensis]|uniref:Uncharacterized protein n=1 Tax=Solea senegalensis TaxID=28829 RepID=A0AAV6S5Y6_SOLSE|nr:hypothetical protein JOB18_046448 [Solea senegalensis]
MFLCWKRGVTQSERLRFRVCLRDLCLCKSQKNDRAESRAHVALLIPHKRYFSTAVSRPRAGVFPRMIAHHGGHTSKQLGDDSQKRRASSSPSNPAIREKAREMEQMLHKWEWPRESWPLMELLICPRRTIEEGGGRRRDPPAQHRPRSDNALLIVQTARFKLQQLPEEWGEILKRSSCFQKEPFGSLKTA